MALLTEAMVFVRSTKNKHLYEAFTPDLSVLGNVYINKTGLPNPPPQLITVTVEEYKEG